MMKTIERRITDAHIEIRTNPDGTVGLSGYAAVFDSPAHGEVVKRSAFNRTLEQRDNARLLVNHGGVPIASVKAGTMSLAVDHRGLKVDAPSLDPLNPTVQELVSAMRRGDIDQMSFAFTATDDPTVSGVRELREVRLYDVSVVTYPWYEDTTVGLTRSAGELVEARSQPANLAAAVATMFRAAPPGKQSYGDVADELCEAICGRLASMTGVSEMYLYIADMGDDWAVYSLYDNDDWDLWQISYTVGTDGTYTIGDPVEVEAVTEYRPLTPEEQAEETAEDASRALANLIEARALLGLAPAA